MKFPNIADIATREVITIDIKHTFEEAMAKMLKGEHRNIIVVDKDRYFVVGVVDILNLKTNNIDVKTPLKDIQLVNVPTIKKDQNILEAVDYLNNSTEYICVVNNDMSLYGLITHTDITENIDPDTLMDNYRIEDFLKLGRRMKWVNKDAKIMSLLEDMVSNLYDNVVVVEDLKPIGIFTTKDIMRLVKNDIDLDVEIKEHMSSPVQSINKNFSIREALSFLKERQFKRVIVVDDDGHLSGIISQKELITLSYSKWSSLMKEYQDELREINKKLQTKNIEYENLASTDALTGLYNRHKFTQLYLSSYESMVQRHNKMSVILLDIDHFKKVNDIYGHNIGDKALIEVSKMLTEMLREVDIVCRWGGEEFIVLLPTADLEGAILIAKKLQKSIKEIKIDKVGSITASFGVSEVREGEEMQDAINRADKALYLAKKDGRDCVRNQSDI
ncbi:diguanylate cyclase [Sulfurimonas hongkongensis]|uniref:diguanylate cyclase n=1 Tax=Sulfurimonas hongkongensis TaxID=1172190 RepID=T0JPJ8_9BACT|nr:diguanylate cyclase [Sulfurimonas hongkongensis]EQB40101.1 diguanylate cyclase [Sulfurimonas hongkongensis]